MALSQQNAALLRSAAALHKYTPVDAILIIPDTQLEWSLVRSILEPMKVLVAVRGKPRQLTSTNVPPTPHSSLLMAQAARDAGCDVIELDSEPAPIRETLSNALLRAVNMNMLRPGQRVVLVYNGIAATSPNEPEPFDTLSMIHLNEHLGRLTSADFRNLQTKVPPEVLRLVVNLAVDIGRHGREGKAVGTMFVVGSARKVLRLSNPRNFNPFRGYPAKERSIRDKNVREQIKNIAMLDGAIIISAGGVAVSACVYIDVETKDVTVPRGFGTRHLIGAAISKHTSAVAVVVSQSSGAVRVFVNGEVALHIETLHQPYTWQPLRTVGPTEDTDDEH